MANQKISELTSLPAPDAADEFAIVDGSAAETKKTTVAQLEAVLDLGNMAGTVNLATQTTGNLDVATQVTGVLPEANGGTGESTYTDGQLLIGNSSDNTLTKSTITAGAGIDVTNGNGSIQIDAETATTANAGISRLSAVNTVDTGTDTTTSITPDALAGSKFGTFVVELQPVLAGTDVATGDLNGNVVFVVPEEMNGMDLVTVGASVVTAGTTGTTDIQIHNITQAADMLSTVITIDSTEKDSSTAATPPVIDGANDDVATGDQIRVDVDAISTTAPQGLIVRLGFRLP